MKRFKIIGLCLVAAFAVSAVAASGASAANPEFLGSFPIHFTSSGGVSRLKAGGLTIKCEHVDNSGVITGAKTGSVDVKFLGCKLSGVAPCKSAGANEEEIVTNLLSMKLGYTNKKTKEVGVALEGAVGTGGVLAEFVCNDEGVPLTAKVEGIVIGAITPINTSTLEFTLNFAEAGNKQALQELEKEGPFTLKVSLEGGAFEEGVEISEDKIFTETMTEIMA